MTISRRDFIQLAAAMGGSLGDLTLEEYAARLLSLQVSPAPSSPPALVNETASD